MSWTGKCALFMWILAALAGQAHADPEAVEAILPVFLDGLPAAWPDGAEGAGLEGQVTLSLVVSETGEVVEVAVAEGAGHGFDEAAVQAAWSYRFTPARDDAGQPSAARIGFVVQFRLDAVPDVALEGQVLRGCTTQSVDGPKRGWKRWGTAQRCNLPLQPKLQGGQHL